MSTTDFETDIDAVRDRLYLTDWRRRIAALYEEVRQLAMTDPAAAHFRWRKAREALYRTHPSSPVPAGERSEFKAIHFPYDPSLRFELALMGEVQPSRAEDAAGPATSGPDKSAATPAGLARLGALALTLPASSGDAPASDRIGHVEIPFASGPRSLAVFWLREYSGGLFVPFRDATNGRETYGGGRYVLDTAKGADLGGDADAATLILDFNFSYQPSCAFDPRWSCPLAPPENGLDLGVRAGERIA